MNSDILDSGISQNVTNLKSNLEVVLKAQVFASFGELTIEASSSNLLQICDSLRNNDLFEFDTLIDLCGVDFLDYPDFNGVSRFAVVVHLLSTSKNHRLRLKVFCSDENLPEIPSLTKISFSFY